MEQFISILSKISLKHLDYLTNWKIFEEGQNNCPRIIKYMTFLGQKLKYYSIIIHSDNYAYIFQMHLTSRISHQPSFQCVLALLEKF